jgi:hypothetical protein
MFWFGTGALIVSSICKNLLIQKVGLKIKGGGYVFSKIVETG